MRNKNKGAVESYPQTIKKRGFFIFPNVWEYVMNP